MKIIFTLIAALASVSASAYSSGLSKDCGKLSIVSHNGYRMYRLDINANTYTVLGKFASVDLEQKANNLDKQNVCVIGTRITNDQYFPVVSIEPQR